MLDPMQLLINFGYAGLFAIIFAESGLLIGFFFPGDSLLFTAGVLASLTLPGQPGPLFSLPVLIIGCFIAAVAGDSVGYTFGRRVGRSLFQREDSLLFKKKYILRAQAFYEKHGAKTIVLARFIPIVRTFAPIVAGIGDMKYRRFVTYNVVGGFFWSVGMVLAGYFLGHLIPADKVDTYLLPIVFLIILISVAPAIYHVLKEEETRAGLIRMITRAKPETKPQTEKIAD